MRIKNILPWLLILVCLAGSVVPAQPARADAPRANPAQSGEVTAYDLILAVNTVRTSYGLPALIEDPIVNAVAQATAEYMAANLMSWHIGDVRGRLARAGYGGGATVWATENFAVSYHMSIDEIMVVWSDEQHMLPMTVPAYCHIGAGVATASNGSTYYIVQAAYTATNSCGPYTYPAGSTPQPGGSLPVSQVIVPVITATPGPDGKIFHEVKAGQSFWAIAVAYHTTIREIEIWNNLSKDTPLWVGQRLFIPSSSTAGYATPTPVGMVVPSTPDADGRIIHTVQSYQALISIAEAYHVTVDSILALNGIQADWPLQIGQKLLISPGAFTPSPTPPPLTAIEMLTPASDGNYYHIVQTGETLSWIAGLYKVSVANLMAWNGLDNAFIIYPQEKLLLRVTPPPTLTFTPGPPTATAADTTTPRPPTATRTSTRPAPSPSVTAAPAALPDQNAEGWLVWVVMAAVGVLVLVLIYRRRS